MPNFYDRMILRIRRQCTQTDVTAREVTDHLRDNPEQVLPGLLLLEEYLNLRRTLA